VLKSLVVKRSVAVSGHKTSVSLEDAFWRSFREIARNRQMTLSTLLASIDSERYHGNLSSAIRLFVLDHYRQGPSKRGRGEGLETLSVASSPGLTEEFEIESAQVMHGRSGNVPTSASRDERSRR
jgi:predicted DNA-binding ribbon-helix-helix protein